MRNDRNVTEMRWYVFPSMCDIIECGGMLFHSMLVSVTN